MPIIAVTLMISSKAATLISIFDRLLQGEVVDMPWSEREVGMTVRAGESVRVAEHLTGDSSQFSIVTETFTLEIDGNRLTIGPVNTHFPGPSS